MESRSSSIATRPSLRSAVRHLAPSDMDRNWRIAYIAGALGSRAAGAVAGVVAILGALQCAPDPFTPDTGAAAAGGAGARGAGGTDDVDAAPGIDAKPGIDTTD